MATENEPANPDQARRVARIRAEIAEADEYIETLVRFGMSDLFVSPYRRRIAMLEMVLEAGW